MPLSINITENKKMPEVELSANSDDFNFLSNYFLNSEIEAQKDFNLITNKSKFYPITISIFRITYIENSNGLLTFKLGENYFEIVGNKKALAKFGRTLLNLSEIKYNHHFHIDYYEDNGILNETNISLTINLSV